MSRRREAATEPESAVSSVANRYRSLDPAKPIRLAFVGQTTYFRGCSLVGEQAGLESSFVEWRTGMPQSSMVLPLGELDPDVVIVFRPELVPPEALEGLRAVKVGFLTEPLPRKETEDQHPDLARRLADLRMIASSNFDRIVVFDPMIVETVRRVVPVWRALPLPVADFFYRPVGFNDNPRPIFVGRSTPYRETFLGRVKHAFDLMHIAHGVSDEDLLPFLAECDIAVNLHNEPYPSFENRVSMHLAAGQLLVSEPLDPTHGLEANIDFVEVSSPDELFDGIFEVVRRPSAWRRMRLSGRRKAEYFRASNVYPRLVADLLLDVDVFGRGLDATS